MFQLKYQVSEYKAQKSKLQEENEQLKFALHISRDEIEEMSILIDTLDKTLAKTLKDNQEMSFFSTIESCNRRNSHSNGTGRDIGSCIGGNVRRKSSPCPEVNGIPLSEARKIFLERNDLKHQLEIVRQKLFSLKDKERKEKEMEKERKEKDRDKSTLQIPTIDSKCTQTEDGDRGLDRNDEGMKRGLELLEEESVQGPVNREPFEKILFSSNRSHSLR